ncbi:MAG: TPM domain-containing protein [Cyanobacteria bacterium J06598_4]
MKTINLFRQTTIIGFIGSAVLLTPLSTQALTVDEVTNPRQDNGGWVTDMADILSDRTENELNSLIANIEAKNGAEIAVVTVPGTAPAKSPKAFTSELFNYWGIGKSEPDNGILFLISIADKRVEIETGYGIENILADAEVARIIDSKITTQYKQGNFDRGTLEGTKALVYSLESPANTQDDLKRIFNIGIENCN